MEKIKKTNVKREAVCMKTPRYFAFVLGMGKIQYHKKEANVFEKENSDIIVDKIHFYTKKEFEDHKVQKNPSGASTIAEAESLTVLCPQD